MHMNITIFGTDPLMLGREGWAVDWDVEPGGSFDELPANIMTYGQRDRRWSKERRNPWQELLSSGLDFGLSFLIAPSLFYLHTQFVVGLLWGKMVPWIQAIAQSHRRARMEDGHPIVLAANSSRDSLELCSSPLDAEFPFVSFPGASGVGPLDSACSV